MKGIHSPESCRSILADNPGFWPLVEAAGCPFIRQAKSLAERIQLDQADVGAGGHFGQPGYESGLFYPIGIVAVVLFGSRRLALDRYLLRAWTDAGVAAGNRSSQRVMS